MNRVFGFVALVVSAAALAIVGWTAGEVERGIATAQSVGPSAPPEAAQPLGAVTGGCTVTKVKFKTDNTTVSTTSGSFVKMPGMSVSFVTTAVGCLKIELSAVARLGTNEVMYVRAMLDEAVGGLPGPVTFAANDPAYRPRAFNFAFANVPAGTHTVSIHWMVSGGTGTVIQRSLFVHYN